MWTLANECTAIQRRQQIGILIECACFSFEFRRRFAESMNFRLFASKNKRTTTSCKLPEFVNEKDLCAGPFRSNFMMLQHGLKPQK